MQPPLARGRPTEIEYLNGEIVRMGQALRVPTPLNELVVALMQRVASERRHLAPREIEEAFLQVQVLVTRLPAVKR